MSSAPGGPWVHGSSFELSGSKRRKEFPLRTTLTLVTVTCVTSLLPATALQGQQPVTFAGEVAARDSADLRGQAREAQARFERYRRNNLDMAWGGWGGHCDEVVGRMCMRYDEGEWEPTPEPKSIAASRDRLLAELAQVSNRIPGDVWVRGQRIRYLAEVHSWDEALEIARGCPDDPTGWCEALAGYALHGAGRYTESERTFRSALRRMEPQVAAEWHNPAVLLRGGEGPLLDPDNALPPDRIIERAWTLADPLFLRPGNDRLTAHYSRYVVSGLRKGTPITYGMSWGPDLEELLVRYGWEVGWERTMPGPGESRSRGIVGHHHPDALTYVPPDDIVKSPARTEPGDWSLDPDQPQSSYAPLYAPHITEADVQVARFWRNDSVLVVAAYRMTPAEDDDAGRHETTHLDAFRPIPDSLSVKAGLFLLPSAGGAMYGIAGDRHPSGGFFLSVPAGEYLLSVEAFSEERALASRSRVGIIADSVPLDVPVLSDALLIDARSGIPVTLAQAARQAWPGTQFRMSDRVGVAWELSGLSREPHTIEYRLTLQKRDRGFMESLGSLVGFGGGPELKLSWSEGTEGGVRRIFRSTDLDLPELDRGRYRLVLEATLPGRGTMVTERIVTVVE